MIRKLKLSILYLSTVFAFVLPLAASGVASAQTPINQTALNGNLCSGTNGDLTGGAKSGCDTSGTRVNSLVTTVIDILSVVVGVVAVIMIIIAGFRYITSGGKQESVTGAKNTIIYAVIGLIIVALAQVIVHFVLNKATTAAGA
jgi:hypothetical protein